MYTGIICACLPCLRPFVRYFFPNLFIFSSRFERRLASINLYSSSPLSWVVRDRKKRGTQRLEELDDTENSVGLSETRTQDDKGVVVEETETIAAGYEDLVQNSEERRTSRVADVRQQQGELSPR